MTKRFVGFLVALALLVSSIPSGVMASPAAPTPLESSVKPVAAPDLSPDLDKVPDGFDPGAVQPMWFDTAMDIVSFTMSAAEFAADPNWWNGIQLIYDGASVIVPGLPSVGAVKGGVNAVKSLLNSSAKLRRAVELGGVQKYWKLLLRRMPSGWQRHHIIEARFASRLDTSKWVMPAIPIDNSAHQLITNKMRSKIPYRPGGNYDDLPVRDILGKHRDAYQELLNETGDRYWEYLRDYTQEILERVPGDVN